MFKVRILATCRRSELLPYTLLIFRTIRVGFPNAQVEVTGNDLKEVALDQVEAAANSSGCSFSNGPRTTHHAWIESLVNTESEPVWLCDTDLILFNSMEDLGSATSLYGWLIPKWNDEFTRCTTMPRIHPCLMLINPQIVREKLEAYRKSFNLMDDINPLPNLFAPITVPVNGGTRFYDVCGLLYHAVGGVGFQDQIKDRFMHFNFGTISDRVLPTLENGSKMGALRDMILKTPELGLGAWRVQEQYYRDRQPNTDGVHIVDSMSPEDIKLAKEWNVALCCGNQDAMTFCDLYHSYVHGIDDLVDTMEDGRPTMSKEQIVGLFFQALILYNSAFFVAYRHLLFPVIIQVTNMYQDSVAWERSPKAHLRKIADVMRTCGGEVYFMVALICGGPEHMNKMSRLIRDRDYCSQHDSNDQPI